MKSISEITEIIKFPKFNDIYGNEIKPGDIIGMTTTGTKYIYTYLVTNKFTGGNRVILVDLINERNKGYLDINETTQDHKQWYMQSVIKLNNAVPAHLKEKAEQFKVKFAQELEQKKIEAVEKRKAAIQERFFPVFLYNKLTKQAGVILTYITSQPGKVISRKDINVKFDELIKNNPGYIIDFLDNDNSLCPITDTKFKPNLISLNKSSNWYNTKNGEIGFNYLDINDVAWYQLKNNINKIFNIFIPIYKSVPVGMTEFKKQYTYCNSFSNDAHHYKIQFKDNSTVRPLGDIFSDAAIEKFHAFLSYYA